MTDQRGLISFSEEWQHVGNVWSLKKVARFVFKEGLS